MEKNVWGPGPPRDEKKRFPEKKILVKKNLFLNFLRRFLLHNSLLEPIVGGFEHLETWGIDRGIRGVNYFVEWTDRMPIHAHFTF